MIFLVKGLKVVAKRCLNWLSFQDDVFVVLNTQTWKTTLGSSILIIKSYAHKQMIESGF